MQSREQRKVLALSDLSPAAFTGNTQIVNDIVQEFGDDPEVMNATQITGETPLILAAMGNEIETVKALLKASAIDVNATCSMGARNGDNALHLAANNGYTEIVDLLAADARMLVNASNARGETALILSTLWCPSTVTTFSNRPDIQPNLKDHHQRSALYYAIARLSRFTPADKLPTHIAALLTIKDIEVNTVNRKEWSLLMVAAAKGHLPTARALLEAGADPCYMASNGFTPQRIAFYAQHDDIAKLIESYAEKKQAATSSQLGMFAEKNDEQAEETNDSVMIMNP